MQMNKTLLLVASMICVLDAYAGQSGDEDTDPYVVARYTSIATTPKPGQVDLLSAYVETIIPGDAVTIGDAIELLLVGSGYRLAANDASDPALYRLMDNTLPVAHRRLGPITLRESLELIAGPAWTLVEDPVNRLVSFDLRKKYYPFAADEAIRHDQ